ncbi:MAG: AraC-like DNA-binding protein [Flavobacteriales bacterium]
MIESTIPVTYLERLLGLARKSGCDVERVFEDSSYDLKSLSNKTEIPAKTYGEIYRRVIVDTQNEWFGMFSGGKVPLGAFRMMALCILHCSDLESAIKRAGQFSEICRGMYVRQMIHREHGRIKLSISANRNVKGPEFESLVSKAQPDAIISSMLTWHRFSEWLIDKDIPVLKVGVTFSKKDLEMPLAYGSLRHIHYAEASNYFVFEEKYLSLPVVQNQNSLEAFLQSAPYHLVTPDTTHLNISDKVRSLLGRNIGHSMPAADDIASGLNVSVTTLRRQLQKENTSYQKLKDECRMDAAFHYLNCAELSNSEIAEHLGFDEPSAFFRSFKKWTGLTPGEYRDRAR